MSKTTYCDSCGKLISSNVTIYKIKIEIFADPELPVLTEEDLQQDFMGQLNDIINEMKDKDVQELTDQVFEAYIFNLCPSCRNDFHKKLKISGKKLFLDS